MEVILLERIEKLGQMGDVVNVKPGFARNYLLPREKALRATEANKKRFETQRAQLETENLQQRDEAQTVADKMEGLIITLIRQAGEAGQLYGSVAARDIAAEVTKAGFTANRSQVNLAHPIKTLGLFDVTVNLHPEVATTVTVNVARSEDVATIQANTGRAVTGDDEEEAAEAAAELEAVFEAGAADAEAEELAEAGEVAAAEEETAE
ncbi:MAG: 50S ribosomal protein L9 [Magnetovibrio sp.]|nr:50S ribosomal protein L9 [Magnetovibrio sp.]